MLPTQTSTPIGKNFWQKPEGKTGKIVMGGIIAALGYGLYKALPYIIILLKNAITATLLGVSLFAIIYVLFIDSTFRNLAWFWYKGAMRSLTSAFIKIDPISIIKTYIRELEKRYSEMDEQIGKLKGQIARMKKIIQENNEIYKHNMNLANTAKKQGNTNMMTLSVRKAGRREASTLKYEELLQRMEYLYKILSKMYDATGIWMEDLKDEIFVKEKERAAILASHSAIKSAMRIMSGDKDKKQMFDDAMEFIADDVANKIGEMERFMDNSKSFIETIDLENGVYEEQGLKMLEEWDKNGLEMLLSTPKKQSEPVILYQTPNELPTQKKFF